MLTLQAQRASRRRKGITAVLAGIMLFAMIFTVGLGYFAYLNVNEGIQGQANASAQATGIAAGQEKLTLTANPCANYLVCSIWLSAKNDGSTPTTIVSVFVTNSAGQLVSTGPTSPYLTGPSGVHQYLNVSLPLTIPIGASTHTMSGCSPTAPVGCDISIGLYPYGFSYTSGNVLVTVLTANGNKFSAQYPPPVTVISSTQTVNNGGSGVTYPPTTTVTQTVYSSTSTSTTITTSTACSLCTTTTSPGASAPSLSVTLSAACISLCGLGYVSYGGTFSVTATVSVAQNSETVNNVALYLTPANGMPSGGAYATAVTPQVASCVATPNIASQGSVIYECDYYGYWVGQGGQITFAGYVVGTGAVDGATITSAEATSNPIQIGSFTSIGPFSVDVLSYSFTSVQNQGGLSADAIGICQSTSHCENKDVAYYVQLTNTLAQSATIIGYSFIENFRPGSDYEYFQVGGVTYAGSSGTITSYPTAAACTSPLASGNTVSATSTVLTTSTMSGVTTNSLRGYYLSYTSGPAAGQNELITANTLTTITTAAFSPAPDASTPDAFTVGCMVLAPNVPQGIVFASSDYTSNAWEWGSTNPGGTGGYCSGQEQCPNGEGVFIVIFYYQNSQISSQVLPFQSETMNEYLCSSSSCSISPSSVTIDQGQSFALTANPSDGVAPYSYQWLQEAPGAGSYTPIGGATSQTYTFATTTSTTTGGWKFEVTMTDADGYSVTSGSDTVTVKPALVAGSVTPSPAIVDSGRSVSLQSAASGGTGSYSYQWYTAPSSGACSPSDTAISGATSSSYSASPTLNTFYCYILIDTGVTSGSSPPAAAYSATDTITVSPAFNAPTITVSPSTIDSGQGSTLSTIAVFNGGTPTYTCQWLQDVPGHGYTNLGNSFPCTAGSFPSTSTGALTTSGTWQFELQVTDSSSNPIYVSNAVTLTVNPPVSAGTLSATPNPVDVNQATTIKTSGTSGGSGSYSYSWTNLPPGCASSNLASIICTPTSTTGSPFTVTLTVTDTLSGTGTGTMSLTVNPALVVPAPTVNHNPADVGQTVKFTETPTGGSGTYNTYTWTGLPTGCTASNSATITCSPSATGSSSVRVSVTDSSGNTVQSGTLSFTVNSALSVPTPTVNHNPANPGQSVTFTETPSGGSIPYTTYTWTGLPSGCTASNSATITCSPSTAGTYSVQVSVTDSSGNTVQSGALTFKIKGAVQAMVLCSSLTGSPCSNSLANVAQGDLIVVVFTSNVNSGTCVTPSGTSPVTDSFGDHFTATTASSGDKTSSGTKACSYDIIYYATASSSGTDTIGVAYSGTATSGAIVAYEAAGVTTPSVAGTPDSCNSGSCSGSLSTASFTYSANGFIVAAGAEYGSGITITGKPGTGFTNTVGTGQANYVGYWVPTSSASSTFAMTKSGSSTTWAELVVEFN